MIATKYITENGGSAVSQNQYKIIDLFCGTGGFSQGFVNYQKKFEVVYAVDIDPVVSATARANHQKAIVDVKDIQKINHSIIKTKIKTKEVDVIIGGPPCQGFSSLRPNRSSTMEDERNNLYTSFATFVDNFKPEVVVLENVVGLITHNSGTTLENVLLKFESLGYKVDWRILNAASYGVPQKRERFIMIASLKRGIINFPTPTHFFSGRVIGHKDKKRQLLADDASPQALSVNDAIGDLPELKSGQSIYKYSIKPQNEYQKARRVGSDILTLHTAAHHSEKMLKVIRHAGSSINSIPKNLITSGFSSCYSRLNGNEPSTTITVKFMSPASSKCIHPTQDRTITPREAARIQSFDDSYRFEGSITQICSQIGNAVPPLLGQAIASTVSKLLSG
jgi:DNA (cytosine-5)-methyltransferase 1